MADFKVFKRSVIYITTNFFVLSHFLELQAFFLKTVYIKVKSDCPLIERSRKTYTNLRSTLKMSSLSVPSTLERSLENFAV